METEHYQQFASILDEFIEVSIMRLSTYNEAFVHHYQVDIRSLLKRERLTQRLIEDCIQFFRSRKIDAHVETYTGALILALDLRTCVLNRDQAALFNVALAHARLND